MNFSHSFVWIGDGRTGRVLLPWRRLTRSVRHCWSQSRAAHRAALSMALQENGLCWCILRKQGVLFEQVGIWMDLEYFHTIFSWRRVLVYIYIYTWGYTYPGSASLDSVKFIEPGWWGSFDLSYDVSWLLQGSKGCTPENEKKNAWNLKNDDFPK